jgi:hypothetical protein
MRRHELWVHLSLIALLSSAPGVVRAQTEVPSRQDEAEQQGPRERWLEQMHRAAPGTDWRAIEEANRERNRQALRSQKGVRITSSWNELGADGQTGRNLVVAASVFMPNRLYVGSALGGMWMGDVRGAGGWTPLTDALGIGVAQIVVVPRTGRDDFVISDGNDHVDYSADGGVTWNASNGLPSSYWGARRLLQDPGTPTRVYALVQDWEWTGATWVVDDILCRSDDAGANFAPLHMESSAGAGTDVWMNRLTGSSVYWLVQNELRRSTDLGYTFTSLGLVTPFVGDADRVRLAASEAGAPKFYAALHSSGSGAWSVYASNGGAAWQTRGSLTDVGNGFDACITDSAQVLAGGVECFRSTDGGATFTKINNWYDYYGNPAARLHADIQSVVSLRIPPLGGGPLQEMLYVNTDGGTYTLGLGASTPANITQTGFRNAQYYSVRTSPLHPWVVSAGSQDQGYQTSTSAPAFTQVISGDYGMLTSSRSTNSMLWSCYPGFLMVQTSESPVSLDMPSSGSGYPNDTGIQWMPYLLADPDDSTAVLFAARHLWRVRHTGPGSFVTLGSLGDFDGGTGDQVGAVAIAPSNHQRWYVATTQGRLWSSANAGTSWNESSSIGPQSHYFYGSDLEVSPTNPLEAYVCGSGYSNPGVYSTTDGGATWNAYGAGLPPTLVHAIAFDSPAADRILYAATEAGPWRCVNGTWQNLLTASGAPLSTYWCVETVPSLGVMRFGTYGRGIWDFSTGRPTAVDGAPANPAHLSLSAAHPNPVSSATTLDYATPFDTRVHVAVYDVAGRQVATLFDGPMRAGWHSVTWNAHVGDALAAPGLYFIRVQAGHESGARRVALAR